MRPSAVNGCKTTMSWQLNFSVKAFAVLIKVKSLLSWSFALSLRVLFCSASLETYLSEFFIALERAKNA